MKIIAPTLKEKISYLLRQERKPLDQPFFLTPFNNLDLGEPTEDSADALTDRRT